MMFGVNLPLPPSTNMMFINSPNLKGKGRFPSPAYKAWKKTAKDIVEKAWENQGRPLIDKPYSVHIRLNVNHQSDIANREKALTDLLVATIPGFPDDCWINRLVVERDRSVEGASIEVVSLPGDARPIGEIIKPILERCADMQLLHLLIQSKSTASEKKQTILNFAGSLSDEEVTLLIQAYGLETA